MANLDGTTLGAQFGSTVWIDRDAAGYGWGSNGMDLLSTLTHELGHALGFDHDHGGVMSATLEAGTRHLSDAHVHDRYEQGAGAIRTSLLPQSLAGIDAVFERLGSSRSGLFHNGLSGNLHSTASTPDRLRTNILDTAEPNEADLLAVLSGKAEQGREQMAKARHRIFDALGDPEGDEAFDLDNRVTDLLASLRLPRA